MSCYNLYDRSSLIKVLKQHKIFLKRSLGQNFLISKEVCSQISQIITNNHGQHLLEIGPGLGNLTKFLLSKNLESLTVIEKDERFEAVIKEIGLINKKINILIADALKVDLRNITTRKIHICGNLPYNVSTQLIFKWIEEFNLIRAITITLQREVARRICAQPGDKKLWEIRHPLSNVL